MQNFNALGNVQFGKDYVLFSIHPQIHPLPAIKQAAAAFLEKACIILDGNPSTEILVELRPRNGLSLPKVAEDFSRLLIKKSVVQKSADTMHGAAHASPHQP